MDKNQQQAHEITIAHIYHGKTSHSLAKIHSVTTARIHQIIIKHLKDLRHPAKIKSLAPFWDGCDNSRLIKGQHMENPQPQRHQPPALTP